MVFRENLARWVGCVMRPHDPTPQDRPIAVRGRRRYAGIWPSRKFRQWWIRRPFSSGRGRILYGGVQPRAMKFLRVGLGLGIVSIGFVVSLVMLLFFFLFFRPTKT